MVVTCDHHLNSDQNLFSFLEYYQLSVSSFPSDTIPGMTVMLMMLRMLNQVRWLQVRIEQGY